MEAQRNLHIDFGEQASGVPAASPTKVKSAFATPSIGDRSAFAPARSQNGTAHRAFGEKVGFQRPGMGTGPFSPVRFALEQSRKTGVFRIFRLGKSGLSL